MAGWRNLPDEHWRSLLLLQAGHGWRKLDPDVSGFQWGTDAGHAMMHLMQALGRRTASVFLRPLFRFDQGAIL